MSLSRSIVSLIAEQGRGIYPSYHFLSILLYGRLGQQSLQFCKFSGGVVFVCLFVCLFVCFIIIRSGRLTEINWSVCVSKSRIIIIIIIYSLVFFTSALTDGLSLEFKWQQVSSLQDPSLYSRGSQQRCSLEWSLLVLQPPSPPVPLIGL